MIFFELVLVSSFSNELFFKVHRLFCAVSIELIKFFWQNYSLSFNMSQENSTTEAATLSNDDLEMQDIELSTATATTSESSPSGSYVPKTARDKFFKDLQ